MEEISGNSKICLYDGSTYVDTSFRKVLKDHLAKVFPATAITEKHLERALDIFATIKKPEFSLKIKDPGFWEISDNEQDFDDGGLEVPW